MKVFKILDVENSLFIGVLLYYEKSGACVIELQESLDEWTAPLLFASYVKKGIFTIPRDISRLWIRERIIPSDRQNIGSILANHKLETYDEMALLECTRQNLVYRIKQGSLKPIKEEVKGNLFLKSEVLKIRW